MSEKTLLDLFSGQNGWDIRLFLFRSVFCSVAKSCLTFGEAMDCSTPGFPVLHHLPECAQTHVHWVGDAIQPSHPLLPASPPALNLSLLRVSSNDSALLIFSLLVYFIYCLFSSDSASTRTILLRIMQVFWKLLVGFTFLDNTPLQICLR